MSERDKFICEFIGYYQYPDAATLWLMFMPYIILFFGTVYAYSEMSSKIGYEADDLTLPEIQTTENIQRAN